MSVFLFRSEKDPCVLGFTNDSKGENLPREFAPWNTVGGQLLPSTFGRSNMVWQAVQREGFYVALMGEKHSQLDE